MKIFKTRLRVYTIVVVLIFSVITARLLDIQVVNGEEYRAKAELKSAREVTKPAPRGEMLDRNGIKIATNKQCFNIMYSNSKMSEEKLNNILAETVRILYKSGEQDKINTQDLPVSYDDDTKTFEFSYNTSNPDTIKRLSDNFKKDNKLDESLDAKGTVYALAEKYELNKLGLEEGVLHKVVALRQALKKIFYKKYQDILIASNIEKNTVFEVESKGDELTGVSTEVAPIRYYPYGEVGSSFIGYMGKISTDNELEKYSGLGYDISKELVGKDRLEGVLENNRDLNVQLRGEPGVTYYKVDKLGNILDKVGSTDAIPGDTVVTTIDMNLQRVLEQSLDNTMKSIVAGEFSRTQKFPNANRGAVVVLSAKTGEILAMASRPGYDPNVFAATGGITDQEIYKKYFLPGVEDKYDTMPKPMYNYATSGTAPPGSTFKPLTAIVGLQEGVVSPSERILDKGVYEYGSFRGKCWIFDDYGTTHGYCDVVRGLQVSCNYYFFEVGKRLGMDRLAEWAYKFGVSTDPKNPSQKPSTGIEINEKPGTVGNPMQNKKNTINSRMRTVLAKIGTVKYGAYTFMEGTEEYNMLEDMFLYNTYNEQQLKSIGITNELALKYIKQQITAFDKSSSYPGDALNIAIGQGATSLTPLQVAQMTATIVNGGTRYSAHLIKEIRNPDGSVKATIEPEILDKLNLNPAYVDYVKKGMEKVNDEGGTAANIFKNYPIKTGGKTGTAQFGLKQGEVGRYAYGWFTSFAPLDDPEIVVAAVIYDAGHGNYAARIIKDVYDEYFKLNQSVTPTP